MTSYNQKDNQGDWEYKIVRSNTNAFRNRNKLERAREEEAMAGWELVEKFDDKRLRFRRPMSAQMNDDQLPPGMDPYRTQYGVAEGALGVIIMLAVVGAILLIVFLSGGFN